MSSSVIAIDRDVLDDMIADGDVQPGMWDERADGRVNLRLGGDLRAKLDRLVVQTGLGYSEVLRRLKLIATLTPEQRAHAAKLAARATGSEVPDAG